MNAKNKWELTFGTGGLRAFIGEGTNALNVQTIARATRGLCKYIQKTKGKSICICFDNRINSELFAHTAAEICAASGLKVYISRELAPTPFLSFCVRRYNAAAGIMITASHNPAKYNGYKVYGADGGQITNDAAEKITKFILKASYTKGAKTGGFENHIKAGKIEYIPGKVEAEYFAAVEEQAVGEKIDKNFVVAYTSLHGTGVRFVPKILELIGVTRIVSPKAQLIPDGNFPTCKSPNPEKPEAMAEVLDVARENNADIALATDPDADRVGVAVKHKGEYVLMTGNEIGVLLVDYILHNCNIVNPVIIKTIVTSTLGDRVAKQYGATVINTLTGFKYIGEEIGKLEAKGEASRFALGFEESYGYLKGAYVRDKDAVLACMLVCELASYYKRQGKTLRDGIEAIYKQYGLYEHKLLSFEVSGAYVNSLRQTPPTDFGDFKIAKVTDYQTQTELNLPRADVLQFDFINGNQVIIRPSGTEPLVKIYITATANKIQNAKFISRVEEYFKNAVSGAL